MVVKWWGPRLRDRLLTIVLVGAFVEAEILWSQRYRLALVAIAAVALAFAERRARRLEREKAKTPVEREDD